MKTIWFDQLNEGGELDAFLALAEGIYGDDPDHFPPARDAVLHGMARAEFLGRQRFWMAERKGKTVARLAARISPALFDDGGNPYGLIGFFEARDDPDAVWMLLAAAVKWLREQGAVQVVGPMDGDTWHRYRFNNGPFDERPFLMEPYNPPHYPELWEGCGFRVLEGYFSDRVPDVSKAADALEAKHERACGLGYTFRPLNVARFDEELELLHRLSCAGFHENLLYNPIPLAEFLAMYRGVERLVDPEMVLIARSEGGSEAGFLFCIPDLLPGNEGPSGAFNMKSVAISPEHRRKSLASAMAYLAYRRAAELGIGRCNACLIRDGNPSAALTGGTGAPLRRYSLYRMER